MSDRLVVIVGGGGVAVRKAKGLIAAGAGRVRCVAIDFDPAMPAEVQRVQEAFEPRHLDGAALVFAATDSAAINDAVVREAHHRGLLVNRADVDEDEPGDFTTPAVWRDEAVLIGVSAGGSPALAARIRDDLARKIDPTHAKMAAAMRELRPIIRESGVSIDQRRAVFRELSGEEAMGVLRSEGVEGLKRWLGAKHAGLSGRGTNRE